MIVSGACPPLGVAQPVGTVTRHPPFSPSLPRPYLPRWGLIPRIRSGEFQVDPVPAPSVVPPPPQALPSVGPFPLPSLSSTITPQRAHSYFQSPHFACRKSALSVTKPMMGVTKKGVDIMRGRPRSRNPKSNLIGIRLSKDDLASVNELAERMRLLPGEIVPLLLRSANVEDLKERIGR
jgi:hypothetical protein